MAKKTTAIVQDAVPLPPGPLDTPPPVPVPEPVPLPVASAPEAPIPVVPVVPLAPLAPEEVDPDALVGAIAEVPPPPESVGAAAFHTPTVEELTAFAPPPPLEIPPAALQDPEVIAPPLESLAEPAAAPAAPIAPDFDSLPARVQAELRAGYALVHGRAAEFKYAPREEPIVQATSGEEPKPQEDVIDWDRLPERTRLELEAGRRHLAARQAEYRDVQRRVQEQAAKDLHEGKIGTLDYPAR